jgi:hypothetical protein
MDLPADPEPAIVDLPPMTYIEVKLPGCSPSADHHLPVREGLWIRVYDDDGDGDYLGDIEWPRIPPGFVH